MRIGTVREIKTEEYRVGLTPDAVQAYVAAGHEVLVQTGAGEGAGYPDADYAAAGAGFADNPAGVFAHCDMIVKVKEPRESEYDLLRPGQLLYTYVHLAADRELTEALLDRGVNTIAYETIETADGHLPCLAPMSSIAGRLAVQEGAKYLEKPMGGRGVLLSGVPGVTRGHVAIIGAGVVGSQACRIAVGMGARVTVLDVNMRRLEELDDLWGDSIQTLYSSPGTIAEILAESDLVIGAVLIHGARAPHLVTRAHLPTMRPGAVIVDVAVDQGGCVETTRPTTHSDPVFTVDNVVHYCVANMPGCVPRTAAQALNNATLGWGLKLAKLGVENACKRYPELACGLNTYGGKLTEPHVAQAHGLPYTAPLDAIR